MKSFGNWEKLIEQAEILELKKTEVKEFIICGVNICRLRALKVCHQLSDQSVTTLLVWVHHSQLCISQSFFCDPEVAKVLRRIYF